jgi:hypothetical protein
MGMVDQVYDRPLTKEGNPWTIKVDTILAALGSFVYRQFPFQFGVIGEEASALPTEKVLAQLARDPQLLIPEPLFRHMHIVPHGSRFPDGLWWTGGKEANKCMKGSK